MTRIFTIVAMALGFIGGCFAFADSWRTSSRFTADGVNLGYGPELMTWWWQHCGEIGFILISIAFLIELFAVIAFHEKA